MCGKHQKAISSPSTFPVERKERSWVIKPSPGGYPKEDCIPLAVIIRDVLGYADTLKEVRDILHRGLCEVDGRDVRDPGLPLGTFSVLSLGNEDYRLVPSGDGFKLIEIDSDEAERKLCKVVDKTKVKGGKLQLNLHDGKNLHVDNFDYGTGSSVLVNLNDMSIEEIVAQEEGVKVMLARGKNRGKVCTLKGKKDVLGTSENRALVETEEGNVLDLPESLVFTLGKNENLIDVE